MKNKIIFKTLMLKGEAGSTIVSMEKTGHVGTADIYTITFNDGSTTEISLENMSAITSVEKTSSTDTEDIYTITCADGSTQTFSVLNHNADFAAMSEDIDTIDARVDNFINSVVPNTVETLWTGSIQHVGDSATLSKAVSNFDYIDLYLLGSADSKYIRVPATQTAVEIQQQNLSDDASSNFLRLWEMGVSISGSTVSITKLIAWAWDDPNNSNPTVTANAQNGVPITRIDGVKVASDTPAEVTDIRVGANGVTYASAGDAVRDQYSELKNDLDSVGSHSTKSIDHTITYNKTINSSGVVITIEGATFGVTNNIYVSDYDSLIITTTNGWGNLLYAFYKDDDTFISGEASSSSGYTTITNKQISIPSDAAYVIISKSNNPFSVSVVYPYELNIKPDFDKLKSAYLTQNIYTDISFTAVGQKYINASGQLTTAVGDTYYISDYVDISSYENVCVTASGNWGNALYAFYDASENVVAVGTIAENASAFTTIIKQNIAVPYGAKYIIVAGRTTSVMPNIQLLNGYAPAPWSNKKWVCVGDSLTEKSANATKKYYDYIADATGITAVDMGVSGSGYARKADQNQAFYQRISDCPTDADVVTIFGSFNDLGAGLPIGSVDDTGTTTIAGCINKTIDNLQTVIPLVNLGIVAPTPWDTTQPSASGNAYDYVSMLKAICERRSIPFLDLWHCSNLRPWDADFRTIAYSHDNGSGTHPDENGHKLIAPRFKGFLETLLL